MAGDLNFPLAGDLNFRLAGDLSDLIWVSSQAQAHFYPPGPEPWLSSDESSSYKMVKFHNMVKLQTVKVKVKVKAKVKVRVKVKVKDKDEVKVKVNIIIISIAP